MTVIFVDVSHHDWDRRSGNLDWAKVRTATSPVMIARATYGDPKGFSPTTRHFGDFQRGATAAGFTIRGGYHNLIRGDAASIARQVDWLRRELDGHSCHWAMADIEPYAELKANGLWPRWSDVQRFHDRWYQIEQRVCAWYLPRWFWTSSKDAPSLGQPDLRGLKGPLVQSHYAGGDGTASQIYQRAGADAGTGWDDFYGGRYPEIWQYTSDANIDGASTKTDANAFRGSFTQLAALLGTQGDDMPNRYEMNADQYGYEVAREQDPIKHITGPDGPVEVPNLPLQRAKRIEAAIDQLKADMAELKEREPGTQPIITDEQLERVLRKVMGSVDGATPQP